MGKNGRGVMGLPAQIADLEDDEMERLANSATEAAQLLKAVSHEGRLMILCYLANGERSVTELEQLLHARQAAVSQQLARLRLEGLVSTRRDGKTIWYRLSDPRTVRILELVYDMFCNPETSDDG